MATVNRFGVLLWLMVGIIVLTAAAKCPPLPFLKNGHYKVYSRTEIRVICEPSFKFKHKMYPTRETELIKCFDGKWDDDNPECMPKWGICEPPAPIENGGITGPDIFEGGDTAQYFCNHGYYLKGKDKLTCVEKTLQWSGHPPRCEAYDPSSLPNLAKQFKKQFIKKMEAVDLGRAIDNNVEREGLDLFIIFDKSSSIQPNQFDRGIQFAKYFINKFNVSNGPVTKLGGTRLAVYTFGTDLKEEMKLDDTAISSTEKALARLEQIKCGEHCDGGTNMAAALSKVYYVVGKSVRRQAKKALMLTSDGVPTYDGNTYKPVTSYADSLKEKDVEIFTIGIGKDIDELLLRQLSTQPPEEHVFLLDNFKDFDEIVDVLRNEPIERPPPTADKCGYISQRFYNEKIVDGGYIAGSWPWLAAVVVKENYGSRLACSAVLICSKWVLTNARCLLDERGKPLPAPKVFVAVGVRNLASPENNQQLFYAVKIIINEKYKNKDRTILHDIALIQLNGAVSFDDYVRPACIQNYNFDMSSKPDLPGVLVGWMIPKEEYARVTSEPLLMTEPSQVSIVISATDLCRVNVPREYDCDAKELFHARGKKIASKTCSNVEMGFPFLMTNPLERGRYSVAGVATYVEGCTLDSKSTVLTRVSLYLKWIKEKTESCTEEHV